MRLDIWCGRNSGRKPRLGNAISGCSSKYRSIIDFSQGSWHVSRSVSERGKGELVQNIDLEHPEYRSKKQMWKRYKDLYVGGEQLKNNAGAYLMRRQKEGN